jgi:hypothetical protein
MDKGIVAAADAAENTRTYFFNSILLLGVMNSASALRHFKLSVTAWFDTLPKLLNK